MSSTKYSKYRPDLFDDFDISDLLDDLSDYFLDSGFRDSYGFHELTDANELRRRTATERRCHRHIHETCRNSIELSTQSSDVSIR